MMLEFNDLDVGSNGEYHTTAPYYRRKLEILKIPEEQILSMMKENALIENEKAIDVFKLTMSDEDAEKHLEEVIKKESFFEDERGEEE